MLIVATLLILQFIPFANANASIINGFIYDAIDDFYLDPTYIYFKKNYEPNDIKNEIHLLQENIAKFEETCENWHIESEDPRVYLKDQIIATQGKFVLFKGSNNGKQLEVFCKSLNGNLPMVKTMKQKSDLLLLTLENNIRTVLAGIRNDFAFGESFFLDGTLASNVVFKKLGCEQTWYYHLYYPNSYRDHYYEYMNWNRNLHLCLTNDFNSEQQENNTHHDRFGITKKFPNICEIPQNQDIDISPWINTFKENCKKHLALLRDMANPSVLRATNLLPSNLPVLKKKPQYIVDLNRNKRSATLPIIVGSIGSIGGFILDSFLLAKTLHKDKMTNSVIQQVLKNSADIIRTNAMVSSLQLSTKKYRKVNLDNISIKIQVQSKLITKIQGSITALDYFSSKINYMINSKDIETSKGLITNEEINNIATKVLNDYGYVISKNPKEIISAIEYDKNSYFISFAIPILRDDERIRLYHITELYQFENNKTLIPILSQNYISIFHESERYTPMTQEEAKKCSKDRICISSHPSYKSTYDICGMSSFFHQSSTCEYITKPYIFPQLTSIGNKTFYSTPNDTITSLKISCYDPRLSSQKHNYRNISGFGYFILNKTCEARIQNADIIIKSVDYNMNYESIESPSVPSFHNFINGTKEIFSNSYDSVINYPLNFLSNFAKYSLMIILAMVIVLIISSICGQIYTMQKNKRKFAKIYQNITENGNISDDEDQNQTKNDEKYEDNNNNNSLEYENEDTKTTGKNNLSRSFVESFV